jgi:protein SCO1/2
VKAAFLIALFALAACEEKRVERLPELGQIPSFELTASDGKAFSSAALEGKIWIADFIFTTCPGPCPRMSAQMKRVEKATAGMIPGVEIVSFTVDPEHDKPAVLADYAKRYAADTARWHFLTGPMERLESLAWGAFKLNHVDGKLEHSTRFTVVDGQGRIRAYIGTEDTDPLKEVLATVDRLQHEI